MGVMVVGMRFPVFFDLAFYIKLVTGKKIVDNLFVEAISQKQSEKSCVF